MTTTPEPWDKAIAEVIAEVVNATPPSNEQMQLVRALRTMLPTIFRTQREAAKKKERERITEVLKTMLVELHDHGTEDVCCGYALGRNDCAEKVLASLEHQPAEH